MNKIEDVKVSQDTLDKKGVATLRTYPSKLGTFGQNGLDAEALKQKFDELPEAIATHFNALCDILIAGNLEEAMAYVASINDHETTKGILNLLSVIGGVLAYNGKELATQEYTEEKVDAEASARAEEDAKKADKTTVNAAIADVNSAIANESAARATEDAKKADKTAVETALAEVTTAIANEASARASAIATAKAEVKAEIINGAPDTLDTLKEIADALAKGDSAIESLLSTITSKTAEAKEEAKRYADEKDAGKLDVPTGANHIWSTDQNGNLAYQTWSQSASGKSLVRRTPYGQVKTNEAVADDDAVPLAQMNTALLDKASGAELVDLASRVTSLEQNGGGGSATVSLVDDAIAYNKRVPSNALPVAAITEIGGATVYVESLLDPNAWAKVEGQTIEEEYGDGRATIGENGEIYVENTSGYGATSYIELPVKLCDLFPNAVMGVSYEIKFYSRDARSGSGESVGIPGHEDGAFTMNEQLYNSNLIVSTVYYEEYYWNEDLQYDESYRVDDDITYYNIRLVPQGKEVGKYYDTKVTGVSVTGRNLWPFKAGTTTQSGVTVTIDDDGTITLNGKCTASYGSLVSRSINVQAGKKYILRDFAEGTFPNDSTPRVSVSSRMNNALHYMLVGNNGDLSNAMGILDSTEVTLLIKPKYGYTYNNCKLRPMLVCGVDEPKEFIPYKKQDFPIPSAVQALPAYGYGYDSELYNRIIFNEDSVVYQQRVTTERTPLSPYAETDITDLMNWDGFFDAEAGGTITFTNQKSDPVPSTVVYQTK